MSNLWTSSAHQSVEVSFKTTYHSVIITTVEKKKDFSPNSLTSLAMDWNSNSSRSCLDFTKRKMLQWVLNSKTSQHMYHRQRL